MNPDTIRTHCDAIDALTQQIRDELLVPDGGGPEPPEPGEGVVVEAGGDLQAALDAGGDIGLAADATWHQPGGYDFTVGDTVLAGSGNNTVTADTGPALSILPGLSTIGIDGLTVGTSDYDVALLVGRNDDQQTTLEASADRRAPARWCAPRPIAASACSKSTGAMWRWSTATCTTATTPRSAIRRRYGLATAPARCCVEGGYFEGGSENLMVGGDRMKIPNCRPTGITIRASVFLKPMAWKDAGIPVKNLLELKDGHDVLIEDCDLSQCWQSAQDGYAFMFTPTNGGSLRNVVVKNCRVHDVGGIMNITGTDAEGENPERTQVAMYGGEYRTNKALMGGSGRFCLITRGPETVVVENAVIAHEGSSFIDVGDDAVVDVLRVVGCQWNYGSYGLRIGGYNHGDNSAAGKSWSWRSTATPSRARTRSFGNGIPDNTYLEPMSADTQKRVDRGLR